MVRADRRSWPDYRAAFITAYPIAKPDPAQSSERGCLRPSRSFGIRSRRWRAAPWMAARSTNISLADAAHHAYDGIAGIAPGDSERSRRPREEIPRLGRHAFSRSRLVDDNAWVPEKLEYQFAASAPMPDGGEKVYVADEYYAGRLDWYSLDVDAGITALDAVPGSETTGLPPDTPFTTIPVPVSFSGMPNTRWWTFEDNATNFGDIDASTTDLAKLLFMEFALVYSNDWFVIPCTLPAGALAKVQGLAVTNVFGERFWIEAAGKGVDEDWGAGACSPSTCATRQQARRPTRRCCCCRRSPKPRTVRRSKKSSGPRRGRQHGMGRREHGRRCQRRRAAPAARLRRRPSLFAGADWRWRAPPPHRWPPPCGIR